MNPLRHPLIVFVSLATIACGPPRLGSEPDDDPGGSDATSSTSSGSESTTWQPSDPETTGMPTTEAFITEPDVVELYQCDPWVQDCPEGEKCVHYSRAGGSWDGTKCVPVMGDHEHGEPCMSGGMIEATDDCDENSSCWNVMEVDGELIGTCMAFCRGTGDDPECPPNSSCLVSGSGSLSVCAIHCDPLAQDCGPSFACYWMHGQFNCVVTSQDIPAGEACGFINDCAAGLLCVTAEVMPGCEGSACCSAFCNVELGDGQCESVPGTTCVPFFEEGTAPPGYELVGVCVSP